MKQIFRIFSIIIGVGVCLWGIFILLKPNKNSKKTFPKLSITQNHFKINLAEKRGIIKIITNNQDKTFGIDLSHYQEKQHINWKKISLTDQKLPIDFILLRATMGTNKMDKNFNHFWEASRQHHKIRGAYHFYYPDQAPTLQAENFIKKIKLQKGDLPPILDIEKSPRRISKDIFIKNIKTFCNILENKYGKKPIIYTYFHFYKNNLNEDFSEYPTWIANYNDVPTPLNSERWNLWQFTEKGFVNGINTKIDINIFNGDVEDLQKMTLN